MPVTVTAPQRQIIDRKIDAGASRLSTFGPADWPERLSRREEDLDVADAGNCPLAIIFGGYDEGLKILGITAPGQSCDYGFCYASGLTAPGDVEYQEWVDAVYAVMNDAWRRKVVHILFGQADGDIPANV